MKTNSEKRTKLTIGISIFAVVFLCSCVFYSKNDYLKDLASFVADVEANYLNYSDADWETADEKYREYTQVHYEKYKSELTSLDRKKIGKAKGKYNALKLKYQGKQLIDNISGGIEQVQGVIEGVIEELE
jgi:hypothetical protein